MSPFANLMIMGLCMIVVAVIAMLAEHYQWGKRMRAAATKREIQRQELYLSQLQSSNEQYPGLYDAEVLKEQTKLYAMLESLR